MPIPTTPVAPVGSEFLVNSTTNDHQAGPTIARLANGDFVVTWQDHGGTLGDTSGWSIKAQLFGANGIKIGGEFLVNTETANEQRSASVTALSNGGFVVTWQDNSNTLGDTSNWGIAVQVFDADGTKIGNELLANTNTYETQAAPTITSIANGGFVVTWVDASGTLGDNNYSSVKAQIFGADGTTVGGEIWSTPRLLASRVLRQSPGLPMAASWPCGRTRAARSETVMAMALLPKSLVPMAPRLAASFWSTPRRPDHRECPASRALPMAAS